MTHDSPATGSGTGATRPAVTTSFRYAPIPEALLYDHDIDPLAIRVYGCLARHGTTASNCYPTHARIASLIGIAKKSVVRPLKALESAGWIVRYPRYDERQNRLADGYELSEVRAPEGTPPLPEGGPLPPSQRGPLPPEEGGHKGEQEEREQENERTTYAPSALADLDPGHVALAEAARFARFWEAYPKRNGKRLARGDAYKVWQRMNQAETARALVGVEHYAAACNSPDGPLAKDAHRWLSHKAWEDWQTPAESNRPRQNGSRSSYLDRPDKPPLKEWLARTLNGQPDQFAIGGEK